MFGYYIEVTKANLELVPEEYIRKQTLVNSERFITEELKEKKPSSCMPKKNWPAWSAAFEQLRLNTAQYIKKIQVAGHVLANLDCLFSLADTASAYGYVKPRFSASKTIEIKGGRHPVVERFQEEPFVPNDVYLDEKNKGF